MTLAKFLDGLAAIFEQPAYNDRHMARQCRDYATIALQLETDDAARREAAKVAAAAALYRERVAFRERAAAKVRAKTKT